MTLPNLDFEIRCANHGKRAVAGVDEVGRGCLAGPVVAASVIFDSRSVPAGLNDSKKLNPLQRERLDLEIREKAVAFAIGVVGVSEIDRINILNASKLAMIQAVQKLETKPDCLLVDGNFKIALPIDQIPIVKGDQKSVSIAAASILAKVYRDNLMVESEKRYPGYAFSQNKGYGSRAHRLGLQKLGPTPIHRKSFKWTPVSPD